MVQHKLYTPDFVRPLKGGAFTTILLFTILSNVMAQNVLMKGRIMDDTRDKSVSNAVAMVLRLSDSLLVKFARSDSNGFFHIEKLPLDTYQVVFSHPDFGDRTFIILCNKNDSILDFKNVLLPIKSVQIAEVTIFGFASPVYFKGDTLIYAADSFRVKPNAAVEDLLKKLPGIRVDKNGKIFSQGEQVDKVLVDGDEFFGSDPTLATKNLPANSIESVQVYNKKNENSTEGSRETEKILNLKLKEEAKNGYFGKISGAGGPPKFYEEQLMFNKFNAKQKISVFNLGSNTLNSQIGWEDINQYGLGNESGVQYSEENDYWISMNSSAGGIPQTLRNGFYYTGQVFKKTKLSFNYTNTHSGLRTSQQISSRYLLADTSYESQKTSGEQKKMESNVLNLLVDQKLDSLTTLSLASDFAYDTGKRDYNESIQFISSGGELQRTGEISNNGFIKKYAVKNTVSLVRDFKKKNRQLRTDYSYNTDMSHSNGILNSGSSYDLSHWTPEIDQQKISETSAGQQMVLVKYTQPLSAKIKAELAWDYTKSKGLQNKRTLDFFNGTYSLVNDSLSNNFQNTRQINRGGLKFSYDVKKKTFYIGTRIRQTLSESLNRQAQQKFSQTVTALLPYAGLRYNLSDNTRFSMGYSTSSKQPGLDQLQPVHDNSDPNFIRTGNPALLPAYSHVFTLGYNFFRPVSGNSLWSTLRFTSTRNDISNSVYYDGAGRSTITPINVQGNYNGNFNLNYSFSLISKKFEIGPEINSSYSNSSGIINEKTNSTKSLSCNGGLYATIHADSGALELTMNGNYGNILSRTTVNSHANKTFITANYSASVSYQISAKWTFASDIMYVYKTQQTKAANASYYIWGATLNKKCLKKETLLLSLEAYDLLNQYINAEQLVNGNVITYSKSNTIGRYILLKATYKFNNNKTHSDEE
jgi:outer membrane receptor protein involved in Fe transport